MARVGIYDLRSESVVHLSEGLSDPETDLLLLPSLCTLTLSRCARERGVLFSPLSSY